MKKTALFLALISLIVAAPVFAVNSPVIWGPGNAATVLPPVLNVGSIKYSGGGSVAPATTTWSSPTTVTGTLSNSASGTAVTGVGTKFLTEFRIGDTLTLNAETQTITAIASDTALTTSTWTGANSAVVGTRAARVGATIYTNGNVMQGIGTRATYSANGITPDASFISSASPHATGDTSVPAPQIMALGYEGASAATAPSLVIAKSRGTEASPSLIQSGDTIGSLVYQSWTAAATWVKSALVTALATQTWTSSAAGTKLVFQTTPNSSTTPSTALTLDQDQSATFAGSLTVGGTLTGLGSLVLGTTGGSRGTIDIVGTAASSAKLEMDNSAGTGGKDWFIGDGLTIADGTFEITDHTDTNKNLLNCVASSGLCTFPGTLSVTGTTTTSNNVVLSSGSGNQNRLLLQVGGTTKGQIGAAVSSGDIITGSATGDINIRTASTGFRVSTDNGGTSALSIDSSSHVFLGSTTTGTNADFLCLTAGGQIVLQASACTISKRALKEDIDQVDGAEAVKVIMALNPVEFNFRHLGPTNSDPNYYHRQAGFIAEEVAAVDPALAVYEPDMKTSKSYRQEAIISKLVKAFQEQQKQIEELRHACAR